MHYGVDGKVIYGMKIEAIQDRKCDDICIDMLSRLLVDVHLDSSKITESLISSYQTSLVETAFLGSSTPGDWALGDFWGPVAEETRNWLDHVSTGRKCFLATPEDARRNLEISLGIEAAVARGAPVTLPLG